MEPNTEQELGRLLSSLKNSDHDTTKSICESNDHRMLLVRVLKHSTDPNPTIPSSAVNALLPFLDLNAETIVRQFISAPQRAGITAEAFFQVWKSTDWDHFISHCLENMGRPEFRFLCANISHFPGLSHDRLIEEMFVRNRDREISENIHHLSELTDLSSALARLIDAKEFYFIHTLNPLPLSAKEEQRLVDSIAETSDFTEYLINLDKFTNSKNPADFPAFGVMRGNFIASDIRAVVGALPSLTNLSSTFAERLIRERQIGIVEEHIASFDSDTIKLLRR